jgi:putative nucleotidyltransferase with HDIG domain
VEKYTSGPPICPTLPGDGIYMVQTSGSYQYESHDGDTSISLSEIISALSFALDLTEGAVLGHALRSCLLGMRIASEAKLPSEQTGSLYFALLLKDIGCSSNAGRLCEIIGGDDRAVKAGARLEDWTSSHKPSLSMIKLLWKNVLPDAERKERAARIVGLGLAQHSNNSEIIGLRCERGASILGKLGMGSEAAQAVRSLDEHWDGDGYPDSMRGEQIPLLARICAIAQHLDVFSSGRGVEKAIEMLEQRSGSWFDPELVRVAVSLHRRGALWANCAATDSDEDTRQAVLDFDAGKRHRLESHQIDQVCEAFADVVDAKSHFTFRHSLGVAEASLGIAMAMGLPADRTQLVRRAALLHDIGKLSVSNTILDKVGKLSAEEWKAVHPHPSVSRRILERIAPFREMALIAGEHHEKLDGSGYPNRLIAPDLSLESRIIAVADVYGALSEERPYRPALNFDEIVSIMVKLVPNKLDADCFDALIGMISHHNEMAVMHALTAVSPVLAFASA